MLREAASPRARRGFHVLNKMVLCLGYATLAYWLVRGVVALLVLMA